MTPWSVPTLKSISSSQCFSLASAAGTQAYRTDRGRMRSLPLALALVAMLGSGAGRAQLTSADVDIALERWTADQRFVAAIPIAEAINAMGRPVTRISPTGNIVYGLWTPFGDKYQDDFRFDFLEPGTPVRVVSVKVKSDLTELRLSVRHADFNRTGPVHPAVAINLDRSAVLRRGFGPVLAALIGVARRSDGADATVAALDADFRRLEDSVAESGPLFEAIERQNEAAEQRLELAAKLAARLNEMRDNRFRLAALLKVRPQWPPQAEQARARVGLRMRELSAQVRQHAVEEAERRVGALQEARSEIAASLSDLLSAHRRHLDPPSHAQAVAQRIEEHALDVLSPAAHECSSHLAAWLAGYNAAQDAGCTAMDPLDLSATRSLLEAFEGEEAGLREVRRCGVDDTVSAEAVLHGIQLPSSRRALVSRTLSEVSNHPRPTLVRIQNACRDLRVSMGQDAWWTGIERAILSLVPPELENDSQEPTFATGGQKWWAHSALVMNWRDASSFCGELQTDGGFAWRLASSTEVANPGNRWPTDLEGERAWVQDEARPRAKRAYQHLLGRGQTIVEDKVKGLALALCVGHRGSN